MGFFNKIKTIADYAIEISKDKISSFIDSEKVKEIALLYFVKINFFNCSNSFEIIGASKS